MVRIKGANSDYAYSLKTGQIEEQKGNHPVYLKIFVCPYDEPSRVEQNDGKVCEGTDKDCPHEGDKQGHALISLHETEGISLVSQKSIKAQGNFAVEPQKGKQILNVSEKEITVKAPLNLNDALVVKPPENQKIVLEVATNTSLVIKAKGGNNVSVKISDAGISLQVGDKAKIQIGSQGDIELSTPNNSGTVKVKGNLEVTGDVTVAGKKLPKQ
ncbi:MAG: hypothetical protein AB1589_02670 [Cyanobacteriota bacterium]